MKKTFLIVLILTQFIACNNDELPPEIHHSKNINAGQKSGIGIHYSDFPNDTLHFEYPSSTTLRLIDLNDDGIDDFVLMFSGTASPANSKANNSIIPLGGNALATPNIDNEIVDTISFNGIIDHSLNWVKDSCIIYNHNWDVSGNTSENVLWNNAKNKYIGAKISFDDKTIYGWIRIEVTNGWSLTLIDFASTVEYEEQAINLNKLTLLST